MSSQQIVLVVITAASGAVLNGIVAAGVMAFATHWLAGRRDKHSRRDQLRLELYNDLIGLILKNEIAIANRGGDGRLPPAELQAEQISFIYRFRLLSPKNIQETYETYKHLIFQSLAQDPVYRPDRGAVDKARDKLLEMVFENANR
jgi:hypothetical protein